MVLQLTENIGRERSVSNGKIGSILRAFVNDVNVASVVPSSKKVAEVICNQINFESSKNIIELGPGDGAITKYLLSQMKADSNLVAFETNSDLVDLLEARSQDPRRKVLNSPAKNIESYCKCFGIEADVVVSGIPLSFISYLELNNLIQRIYKSLAPGGKVIFYQSYIPPFFNISRLRNSLKRYFLEDRIERVFLNIPPLQILSAHLRL